MLFGALALATRLPGLISGRVYNADEATLAVGAQSLLDGGDLYQTIIDRKPPLVFLLYSGVFRLTGTDDLRPVRLLAAVIVVATAVLIAREASDRFGPSAAIPAGMLYVLGTVAMMPDDAQAANFEIFMMAPTVLAVRWSRKGYAARSGAAVAVAAMCKQPAGATLIPVAWLVQRNGGGWKAVGRCIAGAGVAAAVIAVPFGVGEVVRWVVTGNSDYLAIGIDDLGFYAVRLVVAAGVFMAAHLGLLWLAATHRRVRDDADLWLWLVSGVLGVSVGFRFFGHYLVQLLAPLCLIAAGAIARNVKLARPALILAAVSAAVFVSAAAAPGLFDEQPPYEPLAEVARFSTTADETILVWGNVPEVYWAADRAPAGGFTHSEFLTGYSGGRPNDGELTQDDVPASVWDEFGDRFDADPPALVFDTAAAGIRGGDDFPMDAFPELQQRIDRDYELLITVEGVDIYRRVAPSPG
jgi:hypothetical protein